MQLHKLRTDITDLTIATSEAVGIDWQGFRSESEWAQELKLLEEGLELAQKNIRTDNRPLESFIERAGSMAYVAPQLLPDYISSAVPLIVDYLHTRTDLYSFLYIASHLSQFYNFTAEEVNLARFSNLGTYTALVHYDEFESPITNFTNYLNFLFYAKLAFPQIDLTHPISTISWGKLDVYLGGIDRDEDITDAVEIFARVKELSPSHLEPGYMDKYLLSSDPEEIWRQYQVRNIESGEMNDDLNFLFCLKHLFTAPTLVNHVISSAPQIPNPILYSE